MFCVVIRLTYRNLCIQIFIQIHCFFRTTPGKLYKRPRMRRTSERRRRNKRRTRRNPNKVWLFCFMLFSPFFLDSSHGFKMFYCFDCAYFVCMLFRPFFGWFTVLKCFYCIEYEAFGGTVRVSWHRWEGKERRGGLRWVGGSRDLV